MPHYYDDLETADPSQREERLFAQLRKQIVWAVSASEFYRHSLADIEPLRIADRAALAKLPVLNKSSLIEIQEQTPPLGGLETVNVDDMQRLFFSPGPIAEAQFSSGSDHWRMARALVAVGFSKGDRVGNYFNYHLTPAGIMFDEALQASGCAVFPAGVGATDTQIRAILRLGLNGYVGTPDFLKIIMEKALSVGTPISTMKKALVTAGPLFPDLRQWYEEHGIKIRQCYGTAELGLISYESADPSQGMVLDENCIVEIVRPGTGQVVEHGEVGEVVVTTFDPQYPLIRFATGDLSAIAQGTSSCGRTNQMLKGWLGRADQTTKVRGMFVHPKQVAQVIEPFKDVVRARLEVTDLAGSDQLRLLCECTNPEPGLAEQLAGAIRSECRLRGEVDLVEPGSLPNDGKVIDDLRTLTVAV